MEKIRLCRNKLAKKDYKTGELYWKMGLYPSALISFNAVIDAHYDTPFTGPAHYWKGECHRIMGNLEDAESSYLAYLENFPNGDYTDKARRRLESVRESLDERIGSRL